MKIFIITLKESCIIGDLEETDSGDTSNDTTDIPPLTPVIEAEEESVVRKQFQLLHSF